jgi:hypothetical protein
MNRNMVVGHIQRATRLARCERKIFQFELVQRSKGVLIFDHGRFIGGAEIPCRYSCAKIAQYGDTRHTRDVFTYSCFF